MYSEMRMLFSTNNKNKSWRPTEGSTACLALLDQCYHQFPIAKDLASLHTN